MATNTAIKGRIVITEKNADIIGIFSDETMLRSYLGLKADWEDPTLILIEKDTVFEIDSGTGSLNKYKVLEIYTRYELEIRQNKGLKGVDQYGFGGMERHPYNFTIIYEVEKIK